MTATGSWMLAFSCCGRADGYQVCATWDEADAFRQHYIAAEGHDRAAILTELPTPTRIGYHDANPISVDSDA